MVSEEPARGSTDLLVPTTPSVVHVLEADPALGMEDDEDEPVVQLGCAASEPLFPSLFPRAACQMVLRRAIAKLGKEILRGNCSRNPDLGVDISTMNATLNFQSMKLVLCRVLCSFLLCPDCLPDA